MRHLALAILVFLIFVPSSKANANKIIRMERAVLSNFSVFAIQVTGVWLEARRKLKSQITGGLLV